MASAIPSHLKPSGNGSANANVANGEANEFARKHHGKTQSHVVSATVPHFIQCERFHGPHSSCTSTEKVDYERRHF